MSKSVKFDLNRSMGKLIKAIAYSPNSSFKYTGQGNLVMVKIKNSDLSTTLKHFYFNLLTY